MGAESPQLLVDLDRGADASMRPRHHGRGEVESDYVLPVLCTYAPMRPRHDGRGERRPRNWIIFDELGFNEAAPRWARRDVHDLRFEVHVICASMRPRHDGRGEWPRIPMQVENPLLQ